MYFFWYFLLFAAVFCGAVYLSSMSRPNPKYVGVDKKRQLSDSGFCVFPNVLTIDEILAIKTACKKRKYKDIQDHLFALPKLRSVLAADIGDGYELQDYIWIIEKSSVHTCHRDNNGDFFNDGQTYPSYTMLIYLEEMDSCLAVLPASHKDPNTHRVNFTEPMHDVVCSAGDAIVFNANLIHVGAFSKNPDNLRIQMKITHKTDRDKIAYYENFHKVSNRDNHLPLALRKIQRNLSCAFPIISDLTQDENIRTSRGSDNGVNVGVLQSIFSYIFYGDYGYYDLPNAF
jgi:hypothetical protein